ncbi:helix-turn-helix domain-containing protein [Flavobacterium agrisoli]|uniref:AraC family transcriptional regulator n=1 Tax=Flavobacterium agrisoli TaxID=2793066 RepID=A0A934PKW9_9FLAO|nr:helix-turn-helix domain-containing protein [Flavobacterium agrisoli]MBK0370062.1 AraC family transcriptional regulator [Flavobacterium agrisoli]
MKYIIAIGIFQGLLAALLLFRSRIKTNADYLLVSLSTCIALHLSIKFFIYTFVYDPEVLHMMNTFIGFSYLPLLYLFTLKTINKQFIPASKWYVFLPLILGAIGYFATAIILLENSPHAHHFLKKYNSFSGYGITYLNLFFSVLIGYQLKIYKIDAATKKLIVQLVVLFSIMPVIAFVFPVFNWTNFELENEISVVRVMSYLFLILISIRIMLYRNTVLEETKEAVTVKWPSEAILEKDMKSIENEDSRISKDDFKTEIIANKEPETKVPVFEESSSAEAIAEKRREILTQSQMFKILLKLENGMEKERYYTDCDLTLDKLSEITHLNKYHISETLNHFVQKSFYAFVNEYRIQFVKDKLENQLQIAAKISILDLAFEAGFKSKSSFNRYFKEITGATPSEYLKTITTESGYILEMSK